MLGLFLCNLINDYLILKRAIMHSFVSKYLLSIVIVLFFIFYFIATFLYPGGHHLDADYEGFSWLNNYWCDLYAEGYYNDRPNPAMKIAIGATLLVALAFGHFCYIYQDYIAVQKPWGNRIRWAGLLASLSMMPIFIDSLHSISLIVASLFGLVVMIGIIKSIIKNKMKPFLITGWVCVIAIVVCNGMYYLQLMINWLPLVQKIAFTVVLLWLFFLNLTFSKKLSV